MMFGIDLNFAWFLLIGALFSGYAILDGFDMGIGMLHLLVKDDTERRMMINSIGPVWDGNEVWLVTGGGALFSAFPHVYASVFSGFYSAFILLLFVIIFRAIGIEFRSKEKMKWWRQMWDVFFSLSSFFIAFLMGVAVGNLIQGVPINNEMEIEITLRSMLNPYAVMVGVTTVALFMMHGSIYLVMKTEGELQIKVKGWVNNSIIFFVICYVSVTMFTLIFIPVMIENIKANPWLFLLALLNMLAIANIPREIHRKREFWAFLSSCISIAALLGLFAVGIFPNLVPSIEPGNSLSIYNAASSNKTLSIMLIMAGLGMPFVIGYTLSIYWIFRGKVKINDMSY